MLSINNKSLTWSDCDLIRLTIKSMEKIKFKSVKDQLDIKPNWHLYFCLGFERFKSTFNKLDKNIRKQFGKAGKVVWIPLTHFSWHLISFEFAQTWLEAYLPILVNQFKTSIINSFKVKIMLRHNKTSRKSIFFVQLKYHMFSKLVCILFNTLFLWFPP